MREGEVDAKTARLRMETWHSTSHISPVGALDALLRAHLSGWQVSFWAMPGGSGIALAWWPFAAEPAS